MLHLAATTDKFQLVTSAAVTVDVVASYTDLSGTTVTPGNQVTAITTAATTDVVAAPAASTVRRVHVITVRNKHATSSVDVTLHLDRSATDYELHKATLLAGEMLEYVEGLGFFVVQTTRKEWYNRRVTTAYVNATTSFSDITGLTCPVSSGKHYNFIANLFHFSNATTTGAQFGINGPAMTGMRIQALDVVTGSLTAAAMSSNVTDVTVLDTPAIAQTTGHLTTPVLAVLSGWINPSAAGTFAIRGRSEVAVAAGLTVSVGSWLQLWETDN
ncbi:MAG: hypothetical protein H0U18_09935 [Pyrinomonadaceae bacterium]|nr:hypothetical protein [Pyrinomonadaceae bacterium]